MAERDDFDVRFRGGHQDLLDVFAVAVHDDFAARFRWVCRCSIQVADDPSKFVGRMNVAPPPRVVCLRVASASARGTLSLRQPVEHCVLPLQHVVRLGAVRTTRDFGSTSS